MVRLLRLLPFTLVLLAVASGCGAPPPGTSEDDVVGTTSEAIASSDVIARAQAWVDAKVPYCQAPNHKWDAACQKTCNRTGAAAKPEWDPYRSDCSGYVSYAWGLPPPGLVVTGLVQSSVSTSISAADLEPGDALHASDNSHIILFAGWVGGGHSQMTIMHEGDCGKVAEKKNYSVTSISGSTVHFSWGGTYKARRYNSISFEPPSCDRSAGGFTFSCDGEQAGMHCANVNEPEDTDSWSDNFFCSERDLGMQWSTSGLIDGMDCTAVGEPAEAESSGWSDDYLCLPEQSIFALSYSSAGPIEGKSCVQWNEPAEKDSWSDNYVCTEKVHVFAKGQFTFSSVGPIEGKHCVSVDEPDDAEAWDDNYFCSDQDLGMQWSSAGPIAGMKCTHVGESADAEGAAWDDDYLCLPEGASYALTWSETGPIAGKSCVRWYDHQEKSDVWLDNWLCAETLAAWSDADNGDPIPATGDGSQSQQTKRLPADASSGCALGGRAGGDAGSWGVLLGLALLLRRRRTR